jgi:hypothetical protein
MGDFGGDTPAGMGPPGMDMGGGAGMDLGGADGMGFSGPPGMNGGGGRGPTQKKNEDGEPPTLPAPRYTFTVQFCWQETPLTERLETKEQERAREAELQEQQQANQGQPVATNMPRPGGAN